ERERADLLSQTLVHLLATHHSDAIVPYLFSKVSAHLHLDAFMEYRPNGRPLEFRLRSSGGLSPEQEQSLMVVTSGDGLCGMCLQGREPVLTNHIAGSQ